MSPPIRLEPANAQPIRLTPASDSRIRVETLHPAAPTLRLFNGPRILAGEIGEAEVVQIAEEQATKPRGDLAGMISATLNPGL